MLLPTPLLAHAFACSAAANALIQLDQNEIAFLKQNNKVDKRLQRYATREQAKVARNMFSGKMHPSGAKCSFSDFDEKDMFFK